MGLREIAIGGRGGGRGTTGRSLEVRKPRLRTREGGDWLGVADWQRGAARSYGGGARAGSEREAAKACGPASRGRHSAQEPLRGWRRA